MPAPKTSFRPKMRPKKENSTSSPDGIYVTDRDANDAVNRGNNEARRRATEGSPADTPTYMNGGMVKQGYMHGGEVRAGDVRDNSKRGKTY